jgi:hypothetical protein
LTVSPVTVRLQELLAERDTSLVEVLELLAPKPKAPPEEAAPLPKVVPVSDKERVNLRGILARIESAELPEEARLLDPDERSAWIPLFGEIKTALATLARAETAFKGVFANHLDVEVQAKGIKADQDDKGHYLVKGEVGAEDTELVVKREIAGEGKTQSISIRDLEALENAGAIDHKTFLALTSTERYADESKIMQQLRANPALADSLRKVIKLKAKTGSIHVRKAKS